MSIQNQTIEVGVKSEYARLVQRVLRETVDVGLAVDGSVGKGTMSAVCAFAELMNCDPKQGYTPQLASYANKYMQARFASEQTYREIAKRLGCEYHHLRAVCEVESNGSAFLPDGRAVILFERHKFRQQLLLQLSNPSQFDLLNKATDFKAKTAAELVDKLSLKHPDICNSVRGGYLGGSAEYVRLEKAANIHIEAGYASASYGAFQIMGFNHKLAGYTSATAMMLAFNKGEAEQLEGLAKFILAQPTMLKALREGDWTTFACLYNGADFTANSYHIKLARSAYRWSQMA